jgi:hypothetical protein
MNVGQPCRVILLSSALLLLAIIVPGSARAQFSINSPKVEKGEVEVETHGSIQSGFPKAEDDAEEADEKRISHGHEVEIGYGFTDFWKAELGLSFQKPVGDGLEASSIELENTFQLGTIERWNATFGLLASVSLGIGGADEPDAFEFGPLIQFGDEKSGTVILNGIFEKTFGDNREEGFGFEYAAQVRFPVAEKIGLGAEAFGEIEDIGNAPSFDDTELRVGPMLYLSFGDDDDKDKPGGKKGKGGGDDDDKGLKMAAEEPKIELGMGVLFGATDATPDVTFKWDLEVSF